MTNDMTTGSPAKLILSFSVPLLIGNIFQQLYSMADTVIVGRTIGVNALAAVGATGAIMFLILGFVLGITNGFSVITAQKFGAGDEDGLRHSVATSIILCVFTTIIVTLVSVLTARVFLELMDTPSDIIDDSYKYIIVIYYGIFATIFYNMISCIIRALGDSKTPLIFLIVASIINIILDYVFIVFFSMGVEGASYATVIAQLISGILCVMYASKKYPILRLKKSDWKFDTSSMIHHLKVGLPMAFQFSITATGVMVLQWALNSFGSTIVAAFTAASKIDQLATQPILSFGVTMATYAAQNYGAQEKQRIIEGVKKCMLISFIFSIGGGIIVVIFGGFLVQLFVGKGQPDVVHYAEVYLRIVSIFYFVLGLLFIFRNTLQGMGKGFVPMMAGVCELVMRIFAVFFLSGTFGYIGVCLASPIAWIGATVLLIAGYNSTIKNYNTV